jgi:hypothetical protein
METANLRGWERVAQAGRVVQTDICPDCIIIVATSLLLLSREGATYGCLHA